MDEYKGNDFYCDVALTHKDRLKIVYEDEDVLAFHHTKPFWSSVHIVCVPKKHIASFTNYPAEDQSIVDHLFQIARQISSDIERQHGAARVMTNLGEYQDSKHFHIHIAYGKPRG